MKKVQNWLTLYQPKVFQWISCDSNKFHFANILQLHKYRKSNPSQHQHVKSLAKSDKKSTQICILLTLLYSKTRFFLKFCDSIWCTFCKAGNVSLITMSKDGANSMSWTWETKCITLRLFVCLFFFSSFLFFQVKLPCLEAAWKISKVLYYR